MPTPSIESILTCPTLPSLPAVAMRVLELTASDDVRLKEIADCVQADQALTAKILKTVNSSFYGLSAPCPTISRALGYLGLNTVKSLVLGFSLVDSVGESGDEGGFNYTGYWRRSIFTAAAARALTAYVGAGDPEEAFTVALLQDVGLIAMHRALGEDYESLLTEARGDHDALPAIERARFQFDHTEVSARLIEAWRLPESFVAPIRSHHRVVDITSATEVLKRTLALANLAAGALEPRAGAGKINTFTSRAGQWFGFTPLEAEDLLRSVGEDGGQLASLFKVDTGAPPDVAKILAEASERIVQHQITVQQEQDRLVQTNEQLTRQNVTDGLTGVFNRAFFDQSLTEHFDEAKQSNGKLAIAFSDVDRFKSVNDAHGHQVGDAVLVELASRLRTTVGERGTVCRYGGEEFAILLPGLGPLEAARLAEEVRRAIESMLFDLRDVPGPVDELPITLSIGIAGYEPATSSAFGRAEQLLKAADKAVYAAKESGRNCVRVFHLPRSTPAARASATG